MDVSMDSITIFLSPGGGGGSYFPGLIMPASVLLVAVLSIATYIYLARFGATDENSGGLGRPQD